MYSTQLLISGCGQLLCNDDGVMIGKYVVNVTCMYSLFFCYIFLFLIKLCLLVPGS